MNILVLVSAFVLIGLILIQIRDGGLNVSTSSTLQAPIERRWTAKTLHILTIIVSIVFIGSCIALFLI